MVKHVECQTARQWTKMADQMSKMADHHFDLLLFWEPGWVFLQLPAFLEQGITTLFLAGCSNHGYQPPLCHVTFTHINLLCTFI